MLFGFGSLQFLSVDPIVLMVVGGIIITALGATDAIGMTTRQTTVQLTTPDHMRGRAFAFMVLAAQTANNLGILWIGFFSERLGVDTTMYLGGALALLATAIIGLINRPIREYRQNIE